MECNNLIFNLNDLFIVAASVVLESQITVQISYTKKVLLRTFDILEYKISDLSTCNGTVPRLHSFY